MNTALEFAGIAKRYKGFTLDPANFELPSGYIMGLIGPNGAGKTTLIKLVLNLIRGNALKVTLVLAFTPMALVVFAWSGKVDWAMGFALAAGNFLGALAGVRLQILKGHKWVKNVVTVTIVVFAVRLLFSG